MLRGNGSGLEKRRKLLVNNTGACISTKTVFSARSSLENIHFTLLNSFLSHFFLFLSSIFLFSCLLLSPNDTGRISPTTLRGRISKKYTSVKNTLVERITGSHTEDEKFPGQLSCLDPFPLSLAIQVQRFRYAGWPGSNIVQMIFVIKVFANKTMCCIVHRYLRYPILSGFGPFLWAGACWRKKPPQHLGYSGEINTVIIINIY